MAEDIKVGDCVKLNSGGPLMTVTEIASLEGKPHVWCTWFDNSDTKQGTFPLETVEHH